VATLETLAPLAAEEASFDFNGQRVALRHPTGYDVARLARMVELSAPELGLTAQDLADLELSVEAVLKLAKRLLRAVIGEVDLEAETPELGPVGERVCRELGRLAEPPIPALDFFMAPFHVQLEFLAAIVKLEEQTVVGKAARAIAGAIFSSLLRLEAMARGILALAGSRLAGGTTTSSAPSGGPITGQTEPSSPSPS
jgi:hypothetical protein